MAIRYPAWNLVPLMSVPRDAVGLVQEGTQRFLPPGRPGIVVDPKIPNIKEHIVQHQGSHQLVGVETHL